jgi:hypothetical protein
MHKYPHEGEVFVISWFQLEGKNYVVNDFNSCGSHRVLHRLVCKIVSGDSVDVGTFVDFGCVIRGTFAFVVGGESHGLLLLEL